MFIFNRFLKSFHRSFLAITFMPGRLVFTSLTCSECELLGISWTLRMLFLLAGLDLVTVMNHYMDKCNHSLIERAIVTLKPYYSLHCQILVHSASNCRFLCIQNNINLRNLIPYPSTQQCLSISYWLGCWISIFLLPLSHRLGIWAKAKIWHWISMPRFDRTESKTFKSFSSPTHALTSFLLHLSQFFLIATHLRDLASLSLQTGVSSVQMLTVHTSSCSGLY